MQENKHNLARPMTHDCKTHRVMVQGSISLICSSIWHALRNHCSFTTRF